MFGAWSILYPKEKKKTALFFYDWSVYWSFNSWSINPFTWALL